MALRRFLSVLLAASAAAFAPGVPTCRAPAIPANSVRCSVEQESGRKLNPLPALGRAYTGVVERVRPKAASVIQKLRPGTKEEPAAPVTELSGVVVPTSPEAAKETEAKVEETEEKKDEEEEDLPESKRMMQKVKDAGVAGIISYVFWEWAFWGVSVPVCISAGWKCPLPCSPSASSDRLKAQPAPTCPRVRPEQLQLSMAPVYPPQAAPKVEDSPLSTTRHELGTPAA